MGDWVLYERYSRLSRGSEVVDGVDTSSVRTGRGSELTLGTYRLRPKMGSPEVNPDTTKIPKQIRRSD